MKMSKWDSDFIQILKSRERIKDWIGIELKEICNDAIQAVRGSQNSGLKN